MILSDLRRASIIAAHAGDMSPEGRAAFRLGFDDGFWVAEQHVREDMGFLPSLADWLGHIKPVPWMNSRRQLSKELETSATS